MTTQEKKKHAKEKPAAQIDPKAVLELIGTERVAKLREQTPVRGRFESVLEEICKEGAGAFPGNAKADVARAAIALIARCGSEPKPADLNHLYKAQGLPLIPDAASSQPENATPPVQPPAALA